jgi:glycerophosphoryl diester phosphodiesterase
LDRKLISACAFVPVFACFFAIAGGGALHASEDPIAGSARALQHSEPIVIAHRGASGMRPEHTLAAYELALVQGADFIELDLVATSDGILISRHENALAMVRLDENGAIVRDESGKPLLREETTDVAHRPEFADRLTVKQVDGRPVGGWFSEDFTLAEVRTLKARERMPQLRQNNLLYDDTEAVPTLADVVALVRRWEAATGRQPGLYIELKHPTFFAAEGVRLSGEPINLDLAGLLLEELQAAEFTDAGRLFIQCFEVWPLLDLAQRMASRDLAIPLVQLFGDIHNRRYRAAPRDLAYYSGQEDLARYGELTSLLAPYLGTDAAIAVSYAELATPEVLAFMAGHYADGIGPPRSSVLKVSAGADGRTPVVTGAVEPFLEHARAAGLLVHPYTLRAEAPFLFHYQGRPLTIAEEARMLIRAGVDGFFIDQPSEGRLAVDGIRLEAGGPL